MSWLFMQKLAEERIREAQQTGAFDNLAGKGKPLRLEDTRWVPADLRVAYLVLKNGHFLPPEIELRKEIQSLEEMLGWVGSGEERKLVLRAIEEKSIRLDLLKRRSFSLQKTAFYGRRLLEKLRSRYRPAK